MLAVNAKNKSIFMNANPNPLASGLLDNTNLVKCH